MVEKLRYSGYASVMNARHDFSDERAAALCVELAGRIEQNTGSDGLHETAIPVLMLSRYSLPTEPTPIIQQPAVYVVVQGRKRVVVAGQAYVYDPTQYLVVSLDLPVMACIVEATPDAPYLCMTLQIDARELAALLLETEGHVPRGGADASAIYVSPLGPPLLDAFLRLMQLLETPNDIPILAPLILRELYFRLLQGDQHGRLAEIATGDGRLRRVAGAITWIKEHYSEPLRMEDLAKRVNMSVSTLHNHFRTVVGVSPIQYQKRLRLEMARQLLLAGAATSEAIAYKVGYASASQFNREYARLFGQPPRRDAERLRDATVSGAPINSDIVVR